MGKTIIEKIIEAHCGHAVKPGDIADVKIDARIARDFGGANVVKNLQDYALPIDDPSKTYFTFDCNPGGSDQKYATNQQICRIFAREKGVGIYDINQGIGTHLAIENGIIGPGETLISTDSHANILGAIGAFGQGMGDQDIAAAWANGSVWFKVPSTIRIRLEGQPAPRAKAKDIAFAILKKTGANGLLGYAAEFYGDIVDKMTLADRITIASMNTEMGGIIALFPPNQAVIEYCSLVMRKQVLGVYADPDAGYAVEMVVDVEALLPHVARPGHPEDVVPVESVAGIKIDSAFVGSCTNGRYEDMQEVARILNNRKVAPGVVLKIVPATDLVWRQCLENGLLHVFKTAGALVGNAGCAGCAAGQIGQNGPGEVTISSGNRNFTGKQGRGEVYLASPATVAASAVAGEICDENSIPEKPAIFLGAARAEKESIPRSKTASQPNQIKPLEINGRVWVIRQDNIDTDMIFHNRYLAITGIEQMGKYTFDNLAGWEDFAARAHRGDIVVAGKNFGAGSSRQQAVDCFKSLGIALIIAESFGAIYERNAINAALPIMSAPLVNYDIENGEEISVNFQTGEIIRTKNNDRIKGEAFSDIQLAIYRRGGLLQK
ncbi:3-isopropylmalate dehydratase large subunit [candidate division KSB1 bacterium]|nr:3-isopropylmalate dehydratase large subunit [candidate division KSB1 bacterium]